MDTLLSFLFVYYTIYLAGSIGLLMLRNLVVKTWSQTDELLLALNVLLITQSLSLLYHMRPEILLANLCLDIALLVIGKKIFKNYSYSGLTFYIANYLMIGVGILWGIPFLLSLHISFITKVLLIATSPFLIITLPSDIIQLLEQYDVLCREKWNRPRNPNPIRTKKHIPMVSLHVPIHSEPSHIVIETLNVLAQLSYNTYEVLVIDNNTLDPKLWQPVQKHCEKLGKKFRFFHVENLEGAKAGALNFALQHTDPRASVIGVIDADYHADTNFLKDLIGYFDDKKIGFVQTPHDYRGWQKNLYLTLCYWEYKIFFHSTLVSLNERDAALTVGTMCLIQKQALKKAGGWAQWCVTEDSELAIRIHDVGYSSVYVGKTYGRGLIPQTFAGYKKQRYRWTAGPIQEFQHHAKHLSGFSKKPSSLTLLQRIHHLNHGLDNIIIGFTIPLTISSIAVIISMIIHREIIHVPFELWLAATIMLVASPILMWLTYKVTINPSFKEILGQRLASKALNHIITYSALRTLITGKAHWNRTNKFAEKQSFLSALTSTKEELFIGLALACFITIAFLSFPYPGLSLMFLIGTSYISLGYLTAPLMSFINVVSMKKKLYKKSEENTFTIPRFLFSPVSLALKSLL